VAPERANPLVVAQVLAGLRYNDPVPLALLGGRRAMIESPVLRELLGLTVTCRDLDAFRAALA
jgi:hypothetical protein